MWPKCLLAIFLLPDTFDQTLSAPGPPHRSSASPVHSMLQALSSSCALEISVPQKHWPAYSVPATGKPLPSQKATHASLDMFGPLKLDHCGRVRGLTVSVKQPV